MYNYAEALKYQREKKKLSQNELSKQCGISQPLINNYESGKVKPSIDNCIKLADFYGISIDELVGREFGHIE